MSSSGLLALIALSKAMCAVKLCSFLLKILCNKD